LKSFLVVVVVVVAAGCNKTNLKLELNDGRDLLELSALLIHLLWMNLIEASSSCGEKLLAPLVKKPHRTYLIITISS